MNLSRGLLVEQGFACRACLVRGHTSVAIGIGPEEETAGEQVSGIDGLFLGDTVVVVGVGKLEEKLTDVLQVLDTADGPRQVLVFSPGTASEQHAQQAGPDWRSW